ncbi:hypothetical protein PR048_017978 [Dryococelus australis]|uniref:Uncharacterized protein n=1 Tax=Dryococelus australis TaxID=614101 RepID=A0ABQ9HB47_9NEOP|nr:hypothetical protein PR048_017978 [Dryococelus australis]
MYEGGEGSNRFSGWQRPRGAHTCRPAGPPSGREAWSTSNTPPSQRSFLKGCWHVLARTFRVCTLDIFKHVALNEGAVVGEWLAYLPPSKENRVQSPAESLPDFREWESYWTIPLVGGFSRRSPVSVSHLHRLLRPHYQRHRPARFPLAETGSDPAGNRTRIALAGGENSNHWATEAPQMVLGVPCSAVAPVQLLISTSARERESVCERERETGSLQSFVSPHVIAITAAVPRLCGDKEKLPQLLVSPTPCRTQHPTPYIDDDFISAASGYLTRWPLRRHRLSFRWCKTPGANDHTRHHPLGTELLSQLDRRAEENGGGAPSALKRRLVRLSWGMGGRRNSVGAEEPSAPCCKHLDLSAGRKNFQPLAVSYWLSMNETI